MKKLVFILALLIPISALADVNQDKLFTSVIDFCKATGRDKPIVGYVCSMDVKTVDQCKKTGELNGNSVLSQCVAERLNKDEQIVWAKSKLNPTVNSTIK